MPEAKPIDVAPLITWLQAGTPGVTTPDALLDRFAALLVAGGIPAYRIHVFVRTLHPDILGRAFIWCEGQPVQTREMEYGILKTKAFLKNPIPDVVRTRAAVRRKVCDPATPDDYPLVAELRAEGATDYIVYPLLFSNDEIHVASFTARAPAGFSDAQIAALDSVINPLARVAEIYALRRTATTLLNTYVGHGAGARILSGQIRRGHGEEIDAAIWLSDLRGFTALADELPSETLIKLMNSHFERMVDAVESAGGEVLKFIGDGLLAIFPLASERDRSAACAAALRAAREAHHGKAIFATYPDGRPITVSFRIALHVGRVLYGNIGGARRLDFTAMGPAVNLVSRLERVSSTLGRSPVVSAEFAAACGETLEPLGEHQLRGVRAPQVVYGLPAGAPVRAVEPSAVP
jgi:adenylate cyclase